MLAAGLSTNHGVESAGSLLVRGGGRKSGTRCARAQYLQINAPGGNLNSSLPKAPA